MDSQKRLPPADSMRWRPSGRLLPARNIRWPCGPTIPLSVRRGRACVLAGVGSPRDERSNSRAPPVLDPLNSIEEVLEVHGLATLFVNAHVVRKWSPWSKDPVENPPDQLAIGALDLAGTPPVRQVEEIAGLVGKFRELTHPGSIPASCFDSQWRAPPCNIE